MVQRLLFKVAALLAALGWPAAGAQAQATRIVAVGDLHGDYGAWIDVARDARLIDSRNRWAGGRSVLVQTGDITDRGPDSLKIIRHLQQLGREAKAAGGRVIVLVGNHEAMQVTQDLRYVHPGEYSAFVDRQSKARREAAFQAVGGTGTRLAKAAWIADTPLGKVELVSAWAPSGELGKWAASLPAVAIVDGNLFVHGGISAKYALVPSEEINRRVRDALQRGDGSEASILFDEDGPLWYRGLVTRAGDVQVAGRPTIENELTVALKAQGVKRIVIGHTPNLKGVTQHYGGRLVQIDTGMSVAYGGPLGWLEIVGDRLVPHSATRSSQ